jgi:cell envelope opacity-associated protein A
MPDVKQLTKNGSTKLTARQLSVIDDLFAGELEEQQVFEKHKIDRRTYDKWLAEENFASEFDRRIKSAHRHGELIIARFANVAAVKLVALTESANPETARKACLDVISYLRQKVEPVPDDQPEAGKLPDLPPELASRLLAALAASE